MTIKASALLAALVIWATIVPAVVVQPDAWWALVFAVLATGAVASSFWRRLGIARVLGIGGAWAGAAIAIIETPDATWSAIFAFLSTVTILYSAMRREAILHGLAIATAWLAFGAIVVAHEGEAVWPCVMAFLTTGAIANSRGNARALAGILWWAIAAGVIVAAGGDFAWLTAVAFVLTVASVGIGDFKFPTGIEWDLFGRGGGDDESGERFDPFDRGSRAERRAERHARRHRGWREYDTGEPAPEPPPPSGPRRIIIVERDDEAPDVR